MPQTAVSAVPTDGVNKAASPPPYDVLANADANRDEWLHARQALITASEVPIVLGLVGSRVKLWYEKKGLLPREDLSSNEAVEMGNDLEEPNALIFARKTGRKIERAQHLLRSREYPWLGATLDYVQWRDGDPHSGPLECKSTGKKELWPEDSEPDLRYQTQLQSQIIVYGATWGSLSAIIGSPYMHHRWTDYEAHAGIAAVVRDETLRFHESLRTGTPPEADDREDTGWALRHAALDALSGETITLPDLAAEWHEKLEAAKAAKGEHEKQVRYYQNLLGAALGLAKRGRLPDGTAYTFDVVQRKAYAVAATSYRQLRWVKR